MGIHVQFDGPDEYATLNYGGSFAGIEQRGPSTFMVCIDNCETTIVADTYRRDFAEYLVRCINCYEAQRFNRTTEAQRRGFHSFEVS